MANTTKYVLNPFTGKLDASIDLNTIDWQPSVESVVTSLPGPGTLGERHLFLDDSNDGVIIEWDGTEWASYTVPEGGVVVVATIKTIYIYDGAVWADLSEYQIIANFKILEMMITLSISMRIEPIIG